MRSVIEMAHEAGFDEFYPFDSLPLRLNRFADLIRADERDAILKLADSLGWVDVDYIKARGGK